MYTAPAQDVLSIDTEFTAVGTFIGISTIVNMAYLQAQSRSTEIRITSGRNFTNSGLSNKSLFMLQNAGHLCSQIDPGIFGHVAPSDGGSRLTFSFIVICLNTHI